MIGASTVELAPLVMAPDLILPAKSDEASLIPWKFLEFGCLLLFCVSKYAKAFFNFFSPFHSQASAVLLYFPLASLISPHFRASKKLFLLYHPAFVHADLAD